MSPLQRYSPLLFDLDGTVADTFPGIVAAATEALASLRLEGLDERRVTALTGRGIDELVHGLLEATASPPDLFEPLRKAYVGAYERSCDALSVAYPGMVDLIRRLEGKKALITNKAERFTRRIVARLGLEGHFDAVVSGDAPGARLKPDPWAIQEALRQVGPAAHLPLLVGDTLSDVRASRAAGIACVVVRWGHGGPDAAREADAQAISAAHLEAVIRG